MLQHLRSRWSTVLHRPAAWLLRLGVSPDAVSWAGTGAVVVVAAVLLPSGWLVPGALLLGVLVLGDGLDGAMARQSGRDSTWGAFLDSTLDRIADGAILGAVALHLALTDRPSLAGVALWSLVAAQVTSYVRARADSLGLSSVAGLVSRAERLVLLLLAVLLEGIGVPYALAVGLGALAALSTLTVVQRMRAVHRAATGVGPR